MSTVIFAMTAGMRGVARRGLRQAKSAAKSTGQEDQTQEDWHEAPHCFDLTTRPRSSAMILLPVFRIALLLLVAACCAPLIQAAERGTDGFKDPAFNQIPFDEWVARPDQTHLRWTTSLSEVSLSTHQRLAARV